MTAKKKTPKVVKKTIKKEAGKKRVKKTNSSKEKQVKKSLIKPSNKKVAVNSGKKAKKRTRLSKKSESVSLPTNAGPRLITKVEATRSFVEKLHVPIYRIAYVSAFCFFAVGAVSLITFQSFDGLKQSAQVCDSSGCVDDSSSDGADTQNSLDSEQTHEPEIIALDDIPEILDNITQVSFRVISLEEVRVSVLSLNSGSIITLPTSRLSDENYQIVLEPSDFETGNYQITVSAESTYANGIYETILGDFMIEEIEIEPPPVSDTGEDLTSDNETTRVEGSEENDISDELESDEINSDELESDTSPSDQDGQASEGLVIEDEVTNSSSDTLAIFKLSIETTRISLNTSKKYDLVELRIRPEASLQSRFMGSMIEVQSQWLYILDENSLPNGEYELFAIASNDKTETISDSVRLLIDSSTSSNSIDTINNETEPIIEREFYSIESVSETSSSTVAESSDHNHISEIFEGNKETLNELLDKYAVATQGDDSILNLTIQNEIDEFIESIVKEEIKINGIESNSDRIRGEIEAEIDSLLKRVTAFEELRKSRSAGNSAIDTDGDGISDFDETNIFKTDPNIADTDSDGFIDGIEIVQGYDPINATPQAILEYELPTEVFGLKRNDVLAVEKITPIIHMDKSDSDVLIKTKIEGFALPNSYATIYIFSSPTIVTVRTDSNGSFEYVFDKELEDGEHQIFVAFTDNTGAIFAHSEPFRFIKQAEAFTLADNGNNVPLVVVPSIVETSKSNNLRLILGMSILVLGFFLLMLGISLRNFNNTNNEIKV